MPSDFIECIARGMLWWSSQWRTTQRRSTLTIQKDDTISSDFIECTARGIAKLHLGSTLDSIRHSLTVSAIMLCPKCDCSCSHCQIASEVRSLHSFPFTYREWIMLCTSADLQARI